MTPWDSRHTRLTHTSRPALQSSLFTLSCSLLYSFCCRTHEVGFHQFLCTFWILHLIIKKTPKMSAFKPGWGGTRWHLNEEETHLWLSEEEKKDLKMRKGEYFIFLLLPAHEQGGCGDVRGGEGVGGQWGYKQVFTWFSSYFLNHSRIFLFFILVFPPIGKMSLTLPSAVDTCDTYMCSPSNTWCQMAASAHPCALLLHISANHCPTILRKKI